MLGVQKMVIGNTYTGAPSEQLRKNISGICSTLECEIWVTREEKLISNRDNKNLIRGDLLW